VIGTIKSVKGHCNAGHKVGDKFEISCRNAAGLCGWLYYNIFPNLAILQTGGDPWGDGIQVEKGILMRCPDIETRCHRAEPTNNRINEVFKPVLLLS